MGGFELDSQLQKDIADVINRHCAENGSNTPDFILADYLLNCLAAFNIAISRREEWHGRGVHMTASAGTGIDPTPQSANEQLAQPVETAEKSANDKT
jgi:hypothetical protein